MPLHGQMHEANDFGNPRSKPKQWCKGHGKYVPCSHWAQHSSCYREKIADAVGVVRRDACEHSFDASISTKNGNVCLLCKWCATNVVWQRRPDTVDFEATSSTGGGNVIIECPSKEHFFSSKEFDPKVSDDFVVWCRRCAFLSFLPGPKPLERKVDEEEKEEGTEEEAGPQENSDGSDVDSGNEELDEDDPFYRRQRAMAVRAIKEARQSAKTMEEISPENAQESWTGFLLVRNKTNNWLQERKRNAIGKQIAQPVVLLSREKAAQIVEKILRPGQRVTSKRIRAIMEGLEEEREKAQKEQENDLE